MTVTRTDLIDRNGDRMTRIGFPNAAYESFAEAPRQMIGVHFGPADFAEMARSKSPRLRMFAEQAGYKKPRRHAEDDGGQRDEMIDQLRRLGAADEVIQSMPTDALAEMLRLCSGGQGAAGDGEFAEDALERGAVSEQGQSVHGPASGPGTPPVGPGGRRGTDDGVDRMRTPTSPGAVLDQPEGGRRAGLDQLAGKSGVSGEAGQRRDFDEGDDDDDQFDETPDQNETREFRQYWEKQKAGARQMGMSRRRAFAKFVKGRTAQAKKFSERPLAAAVEATVTAGGAWWR